MVLYVSNHLCQLLNIWWLQVYEVERQNVVLNIPQIDTKIISGEEGLPIRRNTHRIDIVVVTILELLLLNALIPLVDCLALWEDYLPISPDTCLGRLTMYLILKLP